MKKTPTSAADAYARADEVIQAYSEELRRHEFIQLKVTSTTTFESATRSSSTPPSTYTVAFHRPNRLALLNVAGGTGINVVSDGKQIQAWMTPNTGKWDVLKSLEAPGGLRLDHATIGKVNATTVDTIWLLKSIIAEDPRALVESQMSDVRYVGVERLKDEELIRLEMKHPEAKVAVWFDSGERRLLRRVFVDFDSNTSESTMTTELRYDDWSFAAIDDVSFVVPSPRKSEADGGE